MTPRSRNWSRTSGRRVVAGLLIGLGLLILVITQFLKSSLSGIGFIAGLVLAAAGATALVAISHSKEPLD